MSILDESRKLSILGEAPRGTIRGARKQPCRAETALLTAMLRGFGSRLRHASCVPDLLKRALCVTKN
jgi:hypothetical protein